MGRFRDVMRATFRGASNSAGPALRAVPGTVVRPEGERHYLVAVPDGAAHARRPLVVVLHGGGATAAQVMGQAFPPSPLSVLLEIGAREQVVVLAPDAGKGGWCGCFAGESPKDDVGFIDALIELAIAQHGVDPGRVYVVGVSRGGWMAYRLAAAIPHRLAAFAAVLAPMPEAGPASAPAVPLPLLVFGAMADPVVPYRGGKYVYALNTMGRVRSVEDTVRIWRELGGLRDAPAVTPIAARDSRTHVTHTVWGADPAGMQVGLYRIDGGGHAEPSALKRYPAFINRLVGRQNGDLEVAEAAWAFFRDKRKMPA
jgi:polyhydroxybutyrate depolymerase